MSTVKSAPQTPRSQHGVPSYDWRRGTLAPALAGSLLLWAALPPLDWWLLGWLAPIPWLLLVRRERLPTAGELEPSATGRGDSDLAGTERAGFGRLPWQRLRSFFARPYPALWLAGFVFWLLAVHWLRLPHPATHFGWLALAFYLAFYLPVFVGLTRVAVHGARIPLIVAAPVVWTGLELARAHLLTGFLMGALGHTQYRWLELIQISDLGGAYAVSFVVMLAAACLARMLPLDGRPIVYWPLVPLAVVLGSTLAYGYWRMASPNRMAAGPRVALIQGSIDADWKQDEDKAQQIHDEYLDLSRLALTRPPLRRIDLVVWPETMYRRPYVTCDDDYRAPWSESMKSQILWGTRFEIGQLAQHFGTPLMLGLDAVHLSNEGEARYNSVVGVDAEGNILGRYDKMHLVMFGEYVPGATLLPWLYDLSPMGAGMAAGHEPQTFQFGKVRYAPDICFETVLPHVIRGQVRALADEGKEPDVLVNLTNDAWFWGSSELDMHLTCGVFRAVELRKPLLVAANGGISAAIDGDGRILDRCPRRQPDVIVRDVPLDNRHSLYLRIGDWPAGLCLAATVALALMGLRHGWRQHGHNA